MHLLDRFVTPARCSRRVPAARRPAKRAPQLALVALALVARARVAGATDRPADPTNYRSVVQLLQPGDTMRLAGGSYGVLDIANRNGRADAPIVIAGPTSGAPAVFNADPAPCCNTIELHDSSFVVVRDVTIDGHDVDGAFGVSAGGGLGNHVHDITIEGCTFVHHLGSQQHDAISTKTPTWGWVIRGNHIVGAGTGIYLGNSDGSMPFINGLIEDNLVEDTVGYGMEIKFQLPRPSVAGLPTAPTTTIIRNNVWIKTDRASPDGDRPNVLVGGFPATGPGADDRYEIYGNLFVHNPRESLLQASGRVTIHDNIFVDTALNAVLVQDHDLPLRQAFVYNNTIYAAATGVHFGSAAPQGDLVAGNAVFAATPVTGTIANARDNVTDTVARAGTYVRAPGTTLGAMDFYPLAGQLRGTAVDLASVAADHDVDRDFNCSSRGMNLYRGAYAGEGTNPGWHLADERKAVSATCGGTSMGDAGVVADASAPPADGGAAGDGGGDGAASGRDAATAGDGGSATTDAAADGGSGAHASGCGCAVPGRDGAPGRPRGALCGIVAAVLAAGAARGRRRRARGPRATAGARRGTPPRRR